MILKCRLLLVLGNVNWVYFQNPKKMKHKSANVVKSKKFIYDSSYIYDRYRIEMQMAFDYLSSELCSYELALTFDRYINYVTWGKKAWSEDDGFLEHYNLGSLYVNLDDERKQFIDVSKDGEEKRGIDSAEYYDSKEKSINNNIEFKITNDKEYKRREYVKKISEPIMAAINKNKSEGSDLGTLLKDHGYKTIGLYGAGYLGKIIWNELSESSFVNVAFICDKKYKTVYEVSNKCFFIPPERISDYNIDALLVTPIHCFDEIVGSINCKVPVISVERLLV